MLLIGLILILLSSYLIASTFKNFLIFYVATLAQIVLNVEILSLFKAINDTNILIFAFLNLIFAFVLYRFKKANLIKPSFDLKRFKNSLKLDNSLLLLFVAFLVFNFVALFLSLTIATVEPDCQTYHFYRALKFVENQSLAHFETNDIRALIMPINSEIIYSWLHCLKKNFFGYGILSYFSYIFVIFAGFKIALNFKFSYRKILFAIFIFSSLPAIIIQTSSMQTDIVVGALLIVSFALFLGKQKTDIFFSSLSLALSLGVKSTAVMALAAFFVLIIGYEILIEKNKKLSKLKLFIPFLILNFLIFSSYNYILNIIQFHNPLSNNAAYLGHKFWGGVEGYFSNLLHFIFQAFDFCGFKWGYYLNYKILAFSDYVFNFLNINQMTGCNVPMEKVNIISDEQIVGFGILGFLAFLPSVFVSIFKFFKNKNKRTILLFLFALAFLINVLVLSGAMAYMIFSIRFIVAFVSLSFLVLVSIYSKKGFIKPFILFFGMFYMLLISTHIRRAPFFIITDNLIKNKFNMAKYQDDYFTGGIIHSNNLALNIYEVIQKRYKNAKKVAIVKTLSSVILYLKTLQNEDFKVDFLNPAQLTKEKLDKYDLVILEEKLQNENVFNPWEEKINYKFEENNLEFLNDTDLKCYFTRKRKLFSDDIYQATEQVCLTYPYMKKINYKQDYVLEFQSKEINLNIYYFIKSN
ncbi:MAG: hypothetical protein IJD57_02925 [Candidatus Gastranaerophilales bacterium]|nr:hypothetical protein [Candidatus Gastranaerophilales bacterium]